MIATQTNLCDFIAESRFFRIPDFQRPYAWQSMQGEAFWDSFRDTVSNSKRHYFGSIVFFEDGENRVIIDGQQRLTTTLLFITACYHTLIDDSRKSQNHTAEELGKTFLYNEDSGELRVVLRGSTGDRATFDRILRRKILPIDEQSKLYGMYQFFVNCIGSLEKLDSYIDVLSRIDMISIQLGEDDDNAQVIFENINATGEPLTDGDKIRNYSLMLNSEEARTFVYNEYWKRLETVLTNRRLSDGKNNHEFADMVESVMGKGFVYRDSEKEYITDFFRTYLVMKYDNKKVGFHNVYTYFKSYYHDKTSEQSIEQLKAIWSDVSTILENYVYLEFHEDITANKVLSVFDDMFTDVTNAQDGGNTTFCIQLLEYYKLGHLSRNDFRNIIITLNKQKKRSIIVGKKIILSHITAHHIKDTHDKYDMHSIFDAYLWYMEGEGDNFEAKTVSDDSLRLSITNENINDSLAYELLLAIDRKHSNYDGRLKVDHVMPKAAHGYMLDEDWKMELGDNWEVVNQRLYGKLCNIALVPYAVSSNKKSSFATKHSLMKNTPSYTTGWILNNATNWDIQTLKARNEMLCSEVAALYEIPKAILSDKIRENYGLIN